MTLPKSLKTSWSDLTDAERAACKYLCEKSHLYFTRLFFKEREGTHFRLGRHHKVLASALESVVSGEITRLIINVPPGYTKTEMAVVAFVSRGLALNPYARFIHASYSDKLVRDNSARIRDTIALEAFQELWPLKFRADTRSKGLWKTAEGGGLLAGPSGGSITGFRAGTMDDGFTGALIIDDPLKPDSAHSKTERERINDRYHATFRSRLAREDVPIIVIMQRLHVDDFSGFLLKGGAGEKWHHLMLPIEIDNAAGYPSGFTHGEPVDHGLTDGPLWPHKHNARDIERLRLEPYVFAGQYAQNPIAEGGALFKDTYLQNRWHKLPPLAWRAIFADTAQKTGERHDFSVFQCWGKTRFGGDALLIDQVRGKWQAPELLEVAKAFWRKHLSADVHELGVLREIAVEDKVSGTGLIQSLARDGILVRGIARHRDKLTRALDVVPQFAIGRGGPARRSPLVAGLSRRTPELHRPGRPHDDQVDATIDAITELLIAPRSMMDVI